ncbi:unnamed protein product [Rotaria sp. Silwood2]|nr:unnamed protein product [Rotaria sp. Silwood2]CAF3337049.1 unnamed protein product [Rotaria sp. Silwood2]CAF4479362.1 unnamed protein product [Rotaria sp. Silwood2]
MMSSTSSIVNQPVLENEINLKLTLNGEFKPKGILKNATSSSYADLINELCNRHKQPQSKHSYFATRHEKNNKEKTNDSIPVIYNNATRPSTSGTSKSIKRVTYSDVIHYIKYNSSESMPITTRYSHSPEKNSPNLDLMNTTDIDSDDDNSVDEVQVYTIDSLQFEELDVAESSDDEPIDDNFY